VKAPRRDSPAWAYALEDAIFHGLCFALLGPAIAFIALAILSSVGSLHRVGLVQATADAVSFISLLGTVYALIAFVVIGPMMFVSGFLVSAVARRFRDDRLLGIVGCAICAAMMVVFMPITGDSDSRFPFPWNGTLQMFVSGVTGFVLVRATRFLRVWRNRAVSTRSSASS
jgi:hypothetical protein